MANGNPNREHSFFMLDVHGREKNPMKQAMNQKQHTLDTGNLEQEINIFYVDLVTLNNKLKYLRHYTCCDMPRQNLIKIV